VHYLSGMFPTIRFSIQPSPLRSIGSKLIRHLASEISSARVTDPAKRSQDRDPLYGEIDYEKRVIEDEARAGGVVYDANRLSWALLRSLGATRLDVANVIITDRLISTFSQDDMRHHLRTVVPGFPSLISIPGIVEAPARPRMYHIKKQALELSGASALALERLRSEFKGRFIDYGDSAIGEVLKGLVLQSLMFHLTLRPFCDEKSCRLFNAHWQEDLIASQVAHNGLCSKHTSQVRALGQHPVVGWLDGVKRQKAFS